MKVTEFIDSIKDELIEKMDKLMELGGFDLDGDTLIFWLHDEEDSEYYDDEIHVPFNMMKLRAGDMGEIGTAISVIGKIESGEYACMLTNHGGVDLSRNNHPI